MLFQILNNFLIGDSEAPKVRAMIHICAFYIFKPLPALEVSSLKNELELMAANHSIRGLALIGREGLNFTISGPAAGIELFETWLVPRLNLTDPQFKHSQAQRHPFHNFKVKIKKEIVSMGQPGVVPSSPVNSHISPQEWHAKLKSGEAVILDTRNDYEVEIGKFENAIDLDIKEFQDFPAKLERSGISKDREVLIYCTGGIRCEKAILEMKKQGYERVSQLQGGILNYLKEYPREQFEGECFVFDYRVALDQDLAPSEQYRLCAHCGQPSAQTLTCSLCESEGVVCHHCTDRGIKTCSKNCANHARLGSSSRRPHLQEQRKRHRL